jgi:uncharacterized protein (TIGR02246 family)
MDPDTTTISQAIAQVNKRFTVAFEEGNAAGLADLYTEDGQLLPPGSAPISGKGGIEAFWKERWGWG